MMRNFPKIFLRAWRAFEFSHGLREAVFLCLRLEAKPLMSAYGPSRRFSAYGPERRSLRHRTTSAAPSEADGRLVVFWLIGILNVGTPINSGSPIRITSALANQPLFLF
jgi:hypothetical protein